MAGGGGAISAPMGRNPSFSAMTQLLNNSTFDDHTASAIMKARDRRDAAKVIDASKYLTLCDRFLDGVAALHKHMLQTEEELAEAKAALRECHVSTSESRKLMDQATVSQFVEREISDDILVLLRDTLRRERTQTRTSLVVLMNENQERNYSIRELQQLVTVTTRSARASNFDAMYCFEAYRMQTEGYYYILDQYRRYVQSRQLPSPTQVSQFLLYVHVQLGVVLSEAMEALFGQFCDFRILFQQLIEAKQYYVGEVVRMADELFALAAERRLEKASTEWLETHLKENLLEGFLNQFSVHVELYNNLSLALNLTLTEKADAQSKAARERQNALEARSELKDALEELEEIRLGFDIVNTKAVETQKQLLSKSGETSKLHDDLVRQKEEKEKSLKQLENLNKEKEILRSMLNAEQAAHQLAKEREEAIEREVSQLRSSLQSADAEIRNWMALVDKEKEAHRATIRSMALK
jgi:hypothetical protein